MLFSSLTFLFFFLPILLILYYIAKEKYKNVILCIASFLFYAWGEPKYIVLMMVSIIVNYIIALFIDKFKNQRMKKKGLLILAIVFNIFMLFVFKYANFLIDIVNSLFHLRLASLELALPIGISFYTFQILSYVIDVYRGEVGVQKNIITLGTYISLFPQLIAGPIVRYSTIEEQLKKRDHSLEKFTSGLKRFVIGLGKKVIIANNMALIADTIFNSAHVTEYGFLILLSAILSYTFQIYFDFSGYSDMAIGLGKMFGFDFLENFNYPYISESITDFWRRWHISLSTWFRDYVYIPLGGNRCSKLRWLFNLFVVWFLTGLWHGASWNFIIWGLYFFVLLLIEKLFLKKFLDRLPGIIRWCYAFLFINLGWLIFRVENVQNLFTLFSNLFSLKKGDLWMDIAHNYYLLNYVFYIPIAFLCSFPIVKWMDHKMSSEFGKKILSNIGLLVLFVLCILYLINNSYNPFIYFRF